jgi:hypothetical protein
MSTAALLILTASLGQPPPMFHIDTVDGPLPAASIKAIGDRFDITLIDKTPRVIAGRDLVALRGVGIPQPTPCPPPYLQLTSGDRLPIVIPFNPQLAEESLRISLATPLSAEGMVVPQALVAAIVLSRAEPPRPTAGRDLVLLTDGDRVAGKLNKIEPRTGVHLQVGDDERVIPLQNIAQIVFDADFQVRPKVAGAQADIVVKGGGRLFADRLELDGIWLVAQTSQKQRIRFTLDSLAALRLHGGRVTYLDELTPAAFEMTPFLDTRWPLVVGASTLGGPLKLGGDAFPLGLGMHSRSRVRYAVDKDSQWFEALVGVDATAGKDAAIAIDVELDGTPVPKIARTLAAGDDPAKLRIDIQGKKTLTIVTDFGPRGDVRGHAVWADARILKK